MDLTEWNGRMEPLSKKLDQRKHNLVDVMFLVISAIMSGAEGWNDIETHGDSKIDWLRQHRPLLTASRGVTLLPAFCAALSSIPCFEALLCWVNEQRTHQGKPIIAFDGKVLRGSFGEMPRMRFSWSRLTIPKMGWC